MLRLTKKLTSYTPAALAPFIQEARTLGYQFFPLEELRSIEQLEQKLYRLVREGVLNSPQSDGNFESFGGFCANLLYPCYLSVNNCFVVATYDEEWIGLAGFTIDRETRIAKSGLTIVQEAHRGRGVAKALKAFSLTQAYQLGARVITTENYATNAPMLAIDRTLGFGISSRLERR